MFAVFRTLSLRSLQTRRSRALLVIASIALGVATLVATRLLNESMWTAIKAATNPLGVADLYVTNGDTGVRADLAARLAEVPGVQEAEPLVIGRARLPDLGDHRHVQFLGLAWRADSAEHNPWGVRIHWTIEPGSVPGLKGSNPQDILAFLNKVHVRPVLVGEQVDAELRSTKKDQLGALMKMVPRDWARWMPKDLPEELTTALLRIQPVGRDSIRFIKVGTVSADGPAGDLVKNAVIVTAADAAELNHQPDLVTRIDLFLNAGADAEQVRKEVMEVLDGKAAVRTSDENEERAQKVMAGMQLGFSLTGAGALVVGLFLVYIVLASTVAERRHEIGILRSVGATRLQVWGLFVGEAIFQGIIGAAIGLPVGVAMAHQCMGFIKSILSDVVVQLETPALQIQSQTLVIAAVAGIVTALLASLVPAIRASEEEPASAVRRAPIVPGITHQIVQLAGSALLLLAGAACMIFHDRLGRAGTYGGFVLVLLSLLLATPPIAAWVARLLQPLARSLFGLQGRLASDNLVRVPGRTGLVITVLTAGVAIFLQTAGVIRSNKEPFMDWIDQSEDADLFISSGSLVTGTGQNLLLENDLGRRVRDGIPEIQATLGVRTRQVDHGDDTVYVIAVDAAGFESAGHGIRGPLVEPSLYGRLRGPGPARTIVSRNFAALNHVKTDDFVRVRGPHGPIKLQVVGEVVDYSYPRGSLIVDRDVYRTQFDDPLVDQFFVYLKPEARANKKAVSDEIMRRWGGEHALFVTTFDENREHMDRLIRRFSLVAYTQEVVVGVVAALGVAFALMISVLQRRRELGILRAIGATQNQILVSVLAEAMLMGVIGTAIGLLVGVGIEWYCVHVLLFNEAGFLFPVLIPWREAALIGGGALLIATLAGLIPAARTMHLRIPEAIAYE